MPANLLVMVVVGLVLLAAYAWAAVAIWRPRYERLPAEARGEATLRVERRGLIIYTLLVGITGLSALLIGGRQIVRLAASANWPTTTGEVTEARIDQETYLGRGTTAERWRPVVTYTYTAGGETYTGSMLNLLADLSYPTREQAESAIAPYVPGTTVEVAYPPDAPQQGVLERRITTDSYLLAASGLVILGLFLISVAMGTRPPWRPVVRNAPLS